MKFFFALLSCFMLSIYSEEQILLLGNLGSIKYISNDNHLTQIQRFSPSEEILYKHRYYYDDNGKLASESFMNMSGEIIYENDLAFVDTLEKELEAYTRPYTKYNASGCLTRLKDNELVYDDRNRLIQVITPDHVIDYTYDSDGKRISRTLDGTLEYYIFCGINEMAILDEDGNVLELRVPGLSTHKDILRPIAIETKTGIYAPILNIQGSIIKLIDIDTREVISLEAADCFGNGLDQNAPTSWIYSGKHYDKEANLVYFGARYYSPELREWLTPDPREQSPDAYLFCLGDPTCYFDPDGEFAITLVSFAWGAGAAITSPVWGPYALCAAAGATVGYLGYEAVNYASEQMHKNKKEDEYKKPKKNISGKEGAKDSPDWARGNKPYKNESGKDFADRLMGNKYGPNNYRKNPGSEYSKIKKWGDRAFE